MTFKNMDFFLLTGQAYCILVSGYTVSVIEEAISTMTIITFDYSKYEAHSSVHNKHIMENK